MHPYPANLIPLQRACIIAVFLLGCMLTGHTQPQSDLETSPPKTFIPYTISKPVATDLAKIKSLIIDTLLDNRMFVLADTSEETNMLRIAIKKGSKFYVINPFESSTSAHDLGSFTVTARPSSLKFKGELVELEWRGWYGWGSSMGFHDVGLGLQLWDLTTFTRYLDFPTHRETRSWDRATADGTFSCQSFAQQVNPQSVVFILKMRCDEPLDFRRKVTDTTDRYTYTFQKSQLTLTGTDNYILPATDIEPGDQPEFIRMIKCGVGDEDWMDVSNNVAVGPFWFVNSTFSVAENTVEALLHRSGKVIRLCEGTYSADQLRSFVGSPSSCPSSNYIPPPCSRGAVPHFPQLTTTANSYVYKADTITIYLLQSMSVDVLVTGIFGDEYASYKTKSDIIWAPVRFDGPGQGCLVTLNSNSASAEIMLRQPAKEKTRAMDKLIAESEKQTLNASGAFRQLARAYLLGANGYEFEAQMILHDLQESNKEEPFFTQAYVSFRELSEGR